jgi:hypothetical protein
MARRNACLDAAIKELRDRGIDYEVVRLKKHMAVRWAVIAHRPRMLTVPNNPGEWNAATNTRMTIRRMLRQDGR